MTAVVFLILALTWAVVLFFWFRSGRKGSSTDSVTRFHRDLHMLERAAPGTRAAANRLREPVGATFTFGPAAPVGSFNPAAPVGRLMAERRPAPHVMAVGLDAPVGLDARAPQSGSDGAVVASRRHRVQRRRRDVLIVLAVVAVATFVLTLATGAVDAAAAQISTDVALGAYVALLARAQRTAGRSRRRRPNAPNGDGRPVRWMPPPVTRPGYAGATGWNGTTQATG